MLLVGSIKNSKEMTQLIKNQEIYFVGEKKPMKVNQVNENYAVCTRDFSRVDDMDLLKHLVEMQAYFTIRSAYDAVKDDVVYTILDLKKGVKSTHNSSSYGIEKLTIATDTKRILKALESKAIELSRRNMTTLIIDEDKTFKKQR